MHCVTRAIVVALWVALSVGICQATVYKWKDDRGKMHYTDDIRKVPREHRPEPKKSKATPEVIAPSSSRQWAQPSPHSKSSSYSKKNDKFNREMGKGFEKMGDAMGKGLAKGMEKMGEELGKAFEGIGELMVIAAANQPEAERRSFRSKEEEVDYHVKQILLGAFMMCQAQFILAKSKTCSKDGPKGGGGKNGWKMKDDARMKRKLKDYDFKIDSARNTRKNLLIRGFHKTLGSDWEISHEGKKSFRKLEDQKKT